MKILSVLAVCAYCVSAEKIKIGELKNLHHGVSGSVFAIDDNTIAIENFNYDGAGLKANTTLLLSFNVLLQGLLLSSGLEQRAAPAMLLMRRL